MSTLKVGELQNLNGRTKFLMDFAWYFDQTIPSINKSLNVSSITDVGVGDYTVNFGATLSDPNHIVAGSYVSPSSAAADRTFQNQTANRTTTTSSMLSCANAVLFDTKTNGQILG